MEKQTKNFEVRYFHWTYRLGATVFTAWFLNTPTQDKSFLTLCLQRNYQEAVLFTFLMGFLVITGVHYITRYLDYYCPWERKLWCRLLGQLFAGVLGMILLCYFGAKGYFNWVGSDINASEYFVLEFPLVQMSIITLNVLYFCFYVWVKKVRNKTAEQFLKGSLGSKSYYIPLKDICYLERKEKLGFIYTKKGQTFHMDYKMRELEHLLDPNLFFKLNRSLMISLDIVIGYKPIKNMQCELMLNRTLPNDIKLEVSRMQTNVLKKLMQKREKLEQEEITETNFLKLNPFT